MSEDTPTTIGPYRILERIGEGGMGSVYVAEQKEPFHRRVALKVIKPGLDTREVLGRFELEHQALALMSHPNIARVYDAGSTADGRPFFVMEYVPGTPITEYCNRHHLGLEERLHLFVQVCHGVQHAHQKGIIHRDLKPTNILVMLQDDEPLPKIIDFGVAKATSRLTANTVYTELGRVIGTPAYMSPEQAEMAAEDVDTRTDVYALGAILYEILSGEAPLGDATLWKGGFLEVQRMIREVDPPRPSERVTRLSPDAAKTTAEGRSVEASTLVRRLRGDLDWITMKALEKERTRRYASASDLAQDVERHLRNEPVVASPPSVGYRLRKFAARNRALVTAVASFVAALVAGLVVSVLMYLQAEDARKGEVRAKGVALAREREATDALRRAEEAAGLLALQEQETKERFAEAQRNLALYSWEAGDRAYEEGDFRRASEEYAGGVERGLEDLDPEGLASQGIYKDPAAVRPRLASALARTADTALYLDAGVADFAVSPSGARLAVSTGFGPLVVWRLGRDEPEVVVPTDEAPTNLHFLDEGTIAYGATWWMTGERFGAVDVDSGVIERRRVFPNHVDSVAAFPDRRRLALGQIDGRVRVVDARTYADLFFLTPAVVAEEEKTPLSQRDRSVRGIAVSSNGRSMVTIGEDREMRLWDLEAREERRSHRLDAYPLDVAFLDDDSALVWDFRGLLRVDLGSDGLRATRVREGRVTACCALGGRRWFVVTDESYGAIDLDGGPALLEPLPPSLAWVRAHAEDRAPHARFAVATERWVVVRFGKALALFDRSAGRWTHGYGRVVGYATIEGFSRDGTILATWGDDFRGSDERFHRPPEVHGLEVPRYARTLPGHDPSVAPRALAVSLDGRRVVTCDDADALRLYEGPTWSLVATGSVGERVLDIAFSADGNAFHVACAGGRLLRYVASDLARPASVGTLGTDLGRCVLATHPPGGVWVGRSDGLVELRREDSLEVERSFRTESGEVRRLAVSKEGDWLAVLDASGVVGIWPHLAADQHWSYKEPSALGAALSADGSLLALGMVGGSVHVLDTASRKVVARFDTMDRNASGVCFDADGRGLVVAGFDLGPIRIHMPRRPRIARYSDHGSSEIVDVAAHPTEGEYASIDERGAIVVRRLDGKGEALRAPPGEEQEPPRKRVGERVLSYSPDGKRLVARTGPREVRVLSSADGRLLRRISAEGESPLTGFVVGGLGADARIYFTQGPRLLVAPIEGTEAPRQIATLPEGEVTRLALDPRGRTCAVGTRDARVFLVDTETRAVRWQAKFPHRSADRERSFLRDAVDAIVLLTIDDAVVRAGIADGTSLASFDLGDGSVVGTRRHWFWESIDAVRGPGGVVISPTIQRSRLLFSSEASATTFEFGLPEPADDACAIAVLGDASGVVACDRSQIFVVPMDFGVLAVAGRDVPGYVKRYLNRGDPHTPQELRGTFRLQSLER
jgi:WD40 repeat protein/tRNA A-37 threonylcarbamoyl transferase component Bud32